MAKKLQLEHDFKLVKNAIETGYMNEGIPTDDYCDALSALKRIEQSIK